MAILGIDFGRTTCRMAVYAEGSPQLLRDERGNEVVEACFGFQKKTKEPAVGEKVKGSFQSDPEMAVEQIQRRMGEDAQISFGAGEGKSQRLTPEEIAAHIFQHLKRSAEARLKEPVDRCVITVPANFPDPARRATKKAGEIAGMTVERIINEPTAAVLAHSHDATLERGHAMVYNLGQATFDVSIVKCMDDAFEILASSGNSHFGGQDFDKALLWHAAEKFEKEHGLSVTPESGNYYRLLFECENAKKELSFNSRTTVNIPFFMVKDGDPVDLAVEVSRSTFEDLIGPLVAETTGSVERVLTDAGISRADLDHLILTGGNTRIPYVQSFIRNVVGQRPLSQIEPEKAVALGAAVQAGIIDGQIEGSREELGGAWRDSDYFEDVEALLQATEDELESGLAPEKEEELQSLIDDLKRALTANEEEQVRRLEEEITDALFDLV